MEIRGPIIHFSVKSLSLSLLYLCLCHSWSSKTCSLHIPFYLTWAYSYLVLRKQGLWMLHILLQCKWRLWQLYFLISNVTQENDVIVLPTQLHALFCKLCRNFAHVPLHLLIKMCNGSAQSRSDSNTVGCWLLMASGIARGEFVYVVGKIGENMYLLEMQNIRKQKLVFLSLILFMSRSRKKTQTTNQQKLVFCIKTKYQVLLMSMKI